MRPITLVKDMLLRNDFVLYFLLLMHIFLFSFTANSNTNNKAEILNHLNSLENFSASFLQNDGKNLSEGKVFIGEKRVRAEYFSPTKILIILDDNKAMYYDYELEEDEFFNPKDTNAWFFYDVFRNPLFFEDGLIELRKNEAILEKTGLDNEGRNFLIKIYFEVNPLMLRSIEIHINDEMIKLSIYNHNYNEDFSKDFFKLINPKFFN